VESKRTVHRALASIAGLTGGTSGLARRMTRRGVGKSTPVVERMQVLWVISLLVTAWGCGAVVLGRGEDPHLVEGSGGGSSGAAASSSPMSVAAADLNGDGVPDLAVANYGSDNVSVLMNQGDGTFAAAVNYSTGSGARSVAAADLNGDGWPDLAVANYGSGDVSVLLNTCLP
jgi:hypothetical protein